VHGRRRRHDGRRLGEAASLAGHLALGKLICLYDDNKISLAAPTSVTFTEDVGKRFEAYGWHTSSTSTAARQRRRRDRRGDQRRQGRNPRPRSS
jgi:hypothetical protein